jgi:hypothetical protein
MPAEGVLSMVAGPESTDGFGAELAKPRIFLTDTEDEFAKP